MQHAHTPGKWIYDDVWALVKGPKGEEICAVHPAQGGDGKRADPMIAKANAALIAAAPTMLEALQEALGWNAMDMKGFDDIQPNMDMLKARQKRIKAALTLAKGV